jgi:hypothetical protein
LELSNRTSAIEWLGRLELLELSAAVERLEPKQFDNGLNGAQLNGWNDWNYWNVWNRPQAEEVVTPDVKNYFFAVT